MAATVDRRRSNNLPIFRVPEGHTVYSSHERAFLIPDAQRQLRCGGGARTRLLLNSIIPDSNRDVNESCRSQRSGRHPPRHFTEHHLVQLFSQAEYEAALAAAGLRHRFDPIGPANLGLFVAHRPA